MLTNTALGEAKRALAERLLGGRLARTSADDSCISREPCDGPAPLSYHQEQVYRHAQTAANSASDSLLYNETITIHRLGRLDVAALEWSLTEIVRRHEAWRTTFHELGGTAVQVVHPASHFALPAVDLRNLPRTAREHVASQLALEDLRRPFNLAQGPLFRFKLVQLADDEYRLFLTAHQIILDGVSVYHILLPEIMALYEAYCGNEPSPLPELAIQCADFSRWQRKREANSFAGDLAYWRRQLGGHPLRLDLPTDHPRASGQSFRGAIEPFAFPKDTSRVLKNFSRNQGVTFFVSTLAVFTALLHRYTAQDDIILGTLAPTRDHPAVQRLLGYFLNPVPLRLDLSGDPSFLDLLQRTRDVVLGALSHSTLPFHLLVEEFKPGPDPSRNPLYQVQFSQEPPMPPLSSGWDLTPMDFESGGAKLDLYFLVDDRPDGILGRVQYNPELFERTTIRRLVRHYDAMLQAIVANPWQQLTKLPYFSLQSRFA
ncbi:MAG: condensation domain-containing protein [Candidatus Acidiferrales bacterium]